MSNNANRDGQESAPQAQSAGDDITLFVSVIIVNYNSGDRLKRCLEALAHQTYKHFEIIVIDNASNDASVKTAQRAGLKFKLIEAEDNLGFAAGNNRAAEHAQGEWLAFLNPDAYAAQDWLTQLVEASKRYPYTDAFGSTQINADDPKRLDGAGDVYHAFGAVYRGHYNWPVEKLPEEGECFAPCAAAAFYRRSAFEALGGFEESFFCYCEDIDLGFRLRLAGGRAVQVAAAKVWHEGSGVTGKRSDFTLYYGHRNRIWTYYRCAPLPILVLTAPFHVLFNVAMLVMFAHQGRVGPYLRALKDGLRGLPRQNAARRRIQKERIASVVELARRMTWSLHKAMRREADIRRIRA